MSEWLPYRTRHSHLTYAAGTACEVRVKPDQTDIIEMKFEDQVVIELPRMIWYCPGVIQTLDKMDHETTICFAILDACFSAAIKELSYQEDLLNLVALGDAFPRREV